MKTFCPNCEKETDSTIVCEVYSCNDCGEDYENYEKPLLKRAEAAEAAHECQIAATKRIGEVAQRTSAREMNLRGAMENICEYAESLHENMGLDDREYLIKKIRAIAAASLSVVEPSTSDVSTTRDVLIDIKTAPDNNPDYNNRD